jgi:uncharacterized protein YecE (DUF72 family)
MDAYPRIRVGISGWRYEPWRGEFYPEGLPQRLELRYASTIFRIIEINGSFYSLQRPESWRNWYEDTPADFVFSIKGPRFITHILRLGDFERPLANFLASGLLSLDDKLGPILWQFPPQMKFDPARFEPFVRHLPHDTAAALELARDCEAARMKGRSYLQIDQSRPLRHAIEVRNESFLVPEFIELLRRHSVALVIAETARKWPMPRDVTADFMYLRLHGDKELYRSGYRPQAIGRWAERIRAWSAGDEPEDLPEGAVRVAEPVPHVEDGRDVYCFFDNTDVKLRAPADAQSLMRALGQTPGTWSGEADAKPPSKAKKTAAKAKQSGAMAGER